MDKLHKIIGTDSHYLGYCPPDEQTKHNHLGLITLVYALFGSWGLYHALGFAVQSWGVKLSISVLLGVLVLNLYRLAFIVLEGKPSLSSSKLSKGDIGRFLFLGLFGLIIGEAYALYILNGSIDRVLDILNHPENREAYQGALRGLNLSTEDLKLLKINGLLARIKLMHQGFPYWVSAICMVCLLLTWIPLCIRSFLPEFNEGTYRKVREQSEHLVIKNSYESMCNQYEQIFLQCFETDTQVYTIYRDPPYNTVLKPKEFNPIATKSK